MPRIDQCLFFLFIQSGKGQAFVFHIIKQIHMKEDLRISVIQSSLFWERRQDNLCHFEGLVAKAAGKSDLVVLPEMFTTGFMDRLYYPLKFSGWHPLIPL